MAVDPEMNRRQFLRASALTAAGAAALPVIFTSDGAWALELSGTLEQRTADTILAAVRGLYPHDTLSDFYYMAVVEDLDASASKDESFAKLLNDGVGDLDAAMSVPFLDLSDGYRTAVLESLQDTSFVEAMRSTAVVSLYNNELVWRHFGYEGASFPHGGYIYRGFDDLAWLPEPPASASPPHSES